MCPKCVQGKSKQGKEEQGGVMKPDIVFFGEGLPDKFHHALEKDKAEVKGAIPFCPSTVIVTCKLFSCTGGSAHCYGIFSESQTSVPNSQYVPHPSHTIANSWRVLFCSCIIHACDLCSI